MNAEAKKWVLENRFGSNCGYIITSATQGELTEARESVRTNSKPTFVTRLIHRLLRLNRFVFRVADALEIAFGAVGLAGEAHSATMPDQLVGEDDPLVLWDHGH